MNTKLTEHWWAKYKPTSLSEYVFQNDHLRLSVDRFIKDQSIPHLLFTGNPGTGKTLLAELLIKELGVDPIDVLTINASDENNIDMVREKIKGFISVFPNGPFKIVFLDEADYITHNGQGMLRRLTVDYADTTRFILACNYEHKIVPALKSRVQHFYFKSGDLNDITYSVAKVLVNERVKFTPKVLEKIVAIGYPDIRKILVLLEQNSVNKVLMVPSIESVDGDYKLQLINLIETDNWKELRRVACANVGQEEWEDVYRFIYDNLHTSRKFKDSSKWEEAIVIIAEHLYRHSLSADAEICFASMAITLGKL